MKGVKKVNLPSKKCPTCGFDFNGEKNGKKTGIMLNTVVNHVKEKSH